MEVNHVLVLYNDQIVFDQIKNIFQEKKLSQFSFTLARNVIQAETLLGMDSYDIIISDVSWQFPNHTSCDHFFLDMINTEKTTVFYLATQEDFIFQSLHKKPRDSILNNPVDIHDIIWKLSKSVSNKVGEKEDQNNKVFSIHDFAIEKEKLLLKLQKSLQMDIRNPLTSVLIGSKALGRRFDEGSPEKSIIKELEHSIKKIKQIVDTFGSEEETSLYSGFSTKHINTFSGLSVLEKASVEII